MKLTIDIENAVEEEAKRMVRKVIDKHWIAAQDALRQEFPALEDRLAKEVSTKAKLALARILHTRATKKDSKAFMKGKK